MSIIGNVGWLGFGNALAKPLWFVFITAFCMRILGTDQYGIMTASLALMAIAVSFSDLGVGQLSIREVARDSTQASTYFSNFILFRSLLSVLAFVAAIATGKVLGYSAAAMVALGFAGVYLLCLNLTEYCRCLFRATERFNYEAFSIIVEKALVIAGGITFLWLYQSAGGVLAGMAGAMVLVLIINAFLVNHKVAPFRVKLFNWSFVKRGLVLALPLGISGVATILYYRTDAVMLEAMKGETAAGLYGSAFRILEAMILLPSIVVSVIFPRLSHLFNSGQSYLYRNVLAPSLLITGIISVLVAVLLTVFAFELIHLLDPNPAFEPSARVLQILVWTFPFMSVNYILSIALISSDDQTVLAFLLGIAVPINVVLNLMLIPHYSMFGAAITTLITQMVITGFMVFRYSTHTRHMIGSKASTPIFP